MLEFFRPFRHKLGVLTLLMACVFMALWVRGFTLIDSIYLATTEIGCKFKFGNGTAECPR